jgi:orotidine-5'-phosphate decarboxylase
MSAGFVERLTEARIRKNTIAVLGVDPQLDQPDAPGVPAGTTLASFCCEIVEACAESVIAIKPQLAFFEARGIDGLHALREVLALARRLDLVTIADAKRGDIGSTSAAYAEAFLGDGDFACDALTVNPYLGIDAIEPFIEKARSHGRGLFVLVKTSNPSSGDFQDLALQSGGSLWEEVARRVNGWGDGLGGKDDNDFSPIGAVIGATYPDHGRRARLLMPRAIILVPGYGAQGAGADDALAASRADGSGVIVNASRSLMYAYLKRPELSPAAAAAEAAVAMRDALNAAAGILRIPAETHTRFKLPDS